MKLVKHGAAVVAVVSAACSAAAVPGLPVDGAGAHDAGAMDVGARGDAPGPVSERPEGGSVGIDGARIRDAEVFDLPPPSRDVARTDLARDVPLRCVYSEYVASPRYRRDLGIGVLRGVLRGDGGLRMVVGSVRTTAEPGGRYVQYVVTDVDPDGTVRDLPLELASGYYGPSSFIATGGGAYAWLGRRVADRRVLLVTARDGAGGLLTEPHALAVDSGVVDATVASLPGGGYELAMVVAVRPGFVVFERVRLDARYAVTSAVRSGELSAFVTDGDFLETSVEGPWRMTWVNDRVWSWSGAAMQVPEPLTEPVARPCPETRLAAVLRGGARVLFVPADGGAERLRLWQPGAGLRSLPLPSDVGGIDGVAALELPGGETRAVLAAQNGTWVLRYDAAWRLAEERCLVREIHPASVCASMAFSRGGGGGAPGGASARSYWLGPPAGSPEGRYLEVEVREAP